MKRLIRITISTAVIVTGLGGLTTRSASAQGPGDFLSRLDANGNGMLDPAETEGRMGEFIKRMAASNPRLDISRPIPISRLSEEFQRMREERMGGGGGGPDGSRGGPGGSRGGPGGGFGGAPGGGPGGMRGGPQFGGRGGDQNQRGGPQFGGRGGDQNQRGRGGDQQGNPYQFRETEIQPLVPQFGEEDVFTPPLGFGAEGELFTVEVSERDRQEAERSFQYYDRNRDGKIDSEEMRRSRYGSDLPMYDRNRDGNITLNEMEFRYARRRVENEQEGGRSNQQRRRESDEDSSESQWAVREDERTSYRIRPVIERLPEGLPDWFARNDADGDGQIMMSEYSTSWSESVLEEFTGYDLNGDGLITPQECLKATATGVMRGGDYQVASNDDSEDSSDSGDSQDASDGGDSSDSSAADRSTPSVSAAAPAPSNIKIDPRYLAYYQKLVAKYDENGDGHLGPSEWGNMSKNPEAADVDGNKLISVEEYARWSMQR